MPLPVPKSTVGLPRSPLRAYVYYSTILGIFSTALRVSVGVDIHPFYFIILSNVFLILWIDPTTKLPRWILYMLTYLSFSGILGILRGTDTALQFVKEFAGIGANAIYYFLFFRMIRYDYVRAFVTYAKASFFVCLLGFPLLALTSVRSGSLDRLQSIAQEPSAFCMLVLPAYFWYASKLLTKGKHVWKVILFTLAVALSRSSLGYLGVGFGILFLPFRSKVVRIALPAVVALLLGLAYSFSADFKLRADDTLFSSTGEDIGKANLSTYALASNLIVTEKVFEESPWFGNGLGSHVSSYRRLVGDIPGTELALQNWGEVNANEAASLTLRLLSEQGIVGLVLVLWVVVHFHAGGRGTCSIISRAILTVCFVKFMRDGIYFGPEQFFFAFIYLLNHARFSAEKAREMALQPSPSIVSSTRRALWLPPHGG